MAAPKKSARRSTRNGVVSLSFTTGEINGVHYLFMHRRVVDEDGTAWNRMVGAFPAASKEELDRVMEEIYQVSHDELEGTEE